MRTDVLVKPDRLSTADHLHQVRFAGRQTTLNLEHGKYVHLTMGRGSVDGVWRAYTWPWGERQGQYVGTPGHGETSVEVRTPDRGESVRGSTYTWPWGLGTRGSVDGIRA